MATRSRFATHSFHNACFRSRVGVLAQVAEASRGHRAIQTGVVGPRTMLTSTSAIIPPMNKFRYENNRASFIKKIAQVDDLEQIAHLHAEEVERQLETSFRHKLTEFLLNESARERNVLLAEYGAGQPEVSEHAQRWYMINAYRSILSRINEGQFN